MFKIPYSLLPMRVLRSASSIFLGIGEFFQGFFPFLKLHLKQAQVDFSVKEYLSMCFLTDLIFFVFFGSFFVLVLSSMDKSFLFGIIATILITSFVFLQQIVYPNVVVGRRIRDIEKNLLPALQNILVQLNSGVPLFNMLVSISEGSYGEVSKEFSKAVKNINAGNPQIVTLEDMAAINPSLFFRRAIWQLVNGMKSGSDMSNVVNEIINLLAEEQILEIQRYGSQLNPLAMFYMLVVVIGPSLGMTLLIVLSSFISLSETSTKLIFWSLYGIVIFFQIMFMGAIKSKRPNLLSD